MKGSNTLKIEKINDNKIKITLDVNDLAKRHIDAKSFIANTPESQDLFWDVMREAEKIGFSVDESMVYVEAHINSTGMFTLIVTKTSQNASNLSVKNKLKKHGYALKRKAQSADTDSNMYRFDNVSSLLYFCKHIKNVEPDESALYSYNNSYYLDTKGQSITSACEFASKQSDPNFVMSKIFEYGNVIYKDNAILNIKKL